MGQAGAERAFAVRILALLFLVVAGCNSTVLLGAREGDLSQPPGDLGPAPFDLAGVSDLTPQDFRVIDLSN
jgi:hypothetical protein